LAFLKAASLKIVVMTTSTRSLANQPNSLRALIQALALSMAAWGICSSAIAKSASTQAPDPYHYMEDLADAKATAWVREQTRKTLSDMRQLPGYKERYDNTLKVLTRSAFSIQYPDTVGDVIYNNYRDASNPSGVWRSTTLEDYRNDQRRNWRVLFRVDAFNREENANWIWGNAQIQPPNLPGAHSQGLNGVPKRAMIFLSRGGSDAGIFREFDLESRKLVPASEGGFEIPEGKNSAYWWSADELLVSADFGQDSRTTSGYARELRLWKRGTPLSSAKPLFSADVNDMLVSWWVDFDSPAEPSQTSERRLCRYEQQECQLLLDAKPSGQVSQRLMAQRRLTFDTYATFLWDGQAFKPLAVPQDAVVRLRAGVLLVETKSAMAFEGRTLAAGSLLAGSYAQAVKGNWKPQLIWEAQARESVFGVVVTQDHIVVNALKDLQSRITIHALDGSQASRELQGLGDFGRTRLWVHSAKNNQLWLNHQSYLNPPTLHMLDLKSAQLSKIHEQGGVTDTSVYKVERGNAPSKDGTLIPYTLIQRKDAARDGKQPTLLYGYGGFGISLTPDYQALPLLNWLDQGGTYVMAHIRGGGEFGNAWTQAAKDLKRQTAYYDFIAVAEELIRAKVTQASQLGIYGASNGGLLVSAVLVQRPELFGAVVSRVPLTDMQRFPLLLAGPSWRDEYGDPDKPEHWAVMQRYSPYHNLKPGVQLPPTLYMANLNDDRVHPAHARKMAAKQAELGNSTWYYEPELGGHGGRATPQIQAEREALLYTFLMGQLKK
jgi:prolyl oligopeptidase